MADDGKFISTYAKNYPTREDVAESSTMWFAVRMRTDRQPAKDVRVTEALIPNRMDFFDKYFGMYLFSNLFSVYYINLFLSFFD